jgi:hypothetical protein
MFQNVYNKDMPIKNELLPEFCLPAVLNFNLMVLNAQVVKNELFTQFLAECCDTFCEA